ncbi:hypothetical protein GGH94_002529 [Coemansia aciculifera]|uniref:Uncharacterized protein n=1 Tax=Coemansia aciculifera TaxID=417176 RepID=A0A9W8IS64_9FUNG|nr:hypothetical protein GGH94_002529 [Coemansia aciculifera]
MSTLSFPLAAKRSKRFKRFSWNQVADGTFPPVSQHSSIRHTDQGTLAPVDTGISAAALTLPPPISLEQQAAEQDLRVAPSELAHAYEQAVQPIVTEAKAVKADEPKPHTEVETEPVEKKNANQHGKKRKANQVNWAIVG